MLACNKVFVFMGEIHVTLPMHQRLADVRGRLCLEIDKGVKLIKILL